MNFAVLSLTPVVLRLLCFMAPFQRVYKSQLFMHFWRFKLKNENNCNVYSIFTYKQTNAFLFMVLDCWLNLVKFYRLGTTTQSWALVWGHALSLDFYTWYGLYSR